MKDFKNRVKNPKKIYEYLDIEFPGRVRPNAFTNAELDAKLKNWLEKINYVET